MITPHRKQHTPSLIHVEILIRVSKRVPSMSQVRYCLRRSLSRLYQHSRSMIGASQIDIIGKHNVIIMQVLPLHTSIAYFQIAGWRMREKHGGQFLLSWNYWTLLNYHAPLNTVDHMC